MAKKTAIQAEVDRMRELVTICGDKNKSNPQAKEELRELLKNSSVCQEKIQKIAGIYEVALRNRITCTNSSDTYQEVLYIKCDQLKQELGYATANPLEKLAIEQIVLCWVNYYETEMRYASTLTQTHSRETGLYWEKRLQYASRRYERALELLSKMRKMNLVVQVNNANNQIVKNG